MRCVLLPANRREKMNGGWQQCTRIHSMIHRLENIRHCWSAVRRRAVYTVRRRCISFSRPSNTHRTREREESEREKNTNCCFSCRQTTVGEENLTRVRTHMHMLQTMFYYLPPLCLLFLLNISTGSTQQTNTCAALKTKLTRYHVHVKYLPEKIHTPLRLCQNDVNTSCCSQFDADQIQNATVIELYQLFELHSMNLYEPLLRLTEDFNGSSSLLDVFLMHCFSFSFTRHLRETDRALSQRHPSSSPAWLSSIVPFLPVIGRSLLQQSSHLDISHISTRDRDTCRPTVSGDPSNLPDIEQQSIDSAELFVMSLAQSTVWQQSFSPRQAIRRVSGQTLPVERTAEIES